MQNNDLKTVVINADEHDDIYDYHPGIYSPPEQMPKNTKMHINDVLFAVVPSNTTVKQLDEIAMAAYVAVLKLWEADNAE